MFLTPVVLILRSAANLTSSDFQVEEHLVPGEYHPGKSFTSSDNQVEEHFLPGEYQPGKSFTSSDFRVKERSLKFNTENMIEIKVF